MTTWPRFSGARVRRTAFIAVTALAGLAGAYTFSAAPPAPTPLRFRSPVEDLTGRTYIEGEKVDAEVVLENTTGEPLTLTALPKSCGCMTLGGPGEGELPKVLAPGSQTSIKVRIDTLGKSGIQPFYVSALGRSQGGEALKATTTIRVMIQAPLLATPEMIYAIVDEQDSAAPLIRSVSLADEWPGEGLAIKQVTSTAGRRLQYKLEPASGEISVLGRVLKKRYDLVLSYSPLPGVESFDETITIRPDDARAKPVLIRLAGSIKKAYQFSPSGITFHGALPGQTLRRLVELRYPPGSQPDVVVGQTPRGVSILEESRASGMIRYSISYAARPGDEKFEGAATFEVRPEGRQLRLPISIWAEASGS